MIGWLVCRSVGFLVVWSVCHDKGVRRIFHQFQGVKRILLITLSVHILVQYGIWLAERLSHLETLSSIQQYHQSPSLFLITGNYPHCLSFGREPMKLGNIMTKNEDMTSSDEQHTFNIWPQGICFLGTKTFLICLLTKGKFRLAGLCQKRRDF